MASLNQVQLIGNLGRDVEMRYMPSGEAVANVALATTSKWKDKTTQEPREETEWHRVTFFGKLAEIVGKFCTKGSSIYIAGRLKTRKYTDKDGVEKYATDIIADQMQLLGSKSDGGQGAAPQQRQAPAQPPRPAPKPAPNFSDMDDDIPF
jgi:single-strand DNA-binding protein